MLRRQNATYNDGDATRTCKFCGRNHPQEKDCCPAWARTCRRCCKMGNKKVHTVDRCERTDEESTMVLDKGRYTKGPTYAEMWMNDKSVKFQINRGATVNILPQTYVSKDDIHPSDVTLHMWNRTTREVVGKTFATLVNPVNQTSYSVQFEVLEGNFTPLLPCSRTYATDNSELQLVQATSSNHDNKHIGWVCRRIRWRTRNPTGKRTPARGRGRKASPVSCQESASYTQTDAESWAWQNGWEGSHLSHREANWAVK